MLIFSCGVQGCRVRLYIRTATDRNIQITKLSRRGGGIEENTERSNTNRI